MPDSLEMLYLSISKYILNLLKVITLQECEGERMYYHGKSRLLGNVLVNHGLITEEQLESALAEQKINRKRLGDILVDNGWICERDLTQGISKQLFISYIEMNEMDPTPQALALVPESIAERLEIVPLKVTDNTLSIAIAEPLNLLALDELRMITGLNIEMAVATATDIRMAICKWYKEQECSPGIFESEKCFRLGEILFTAGLISERQLKEALEEQDFNKKRLGEIFMEHGWINELQLIDAVSKQLQIPMILLSSHVPSPDALRLVPRAMAERFGILPVSLLANSQIRIAMTEPLRGEALGELRAAVDREIEFAIALPSAIRREIPRFYRVLELEEISGSSGGYSEKGALLGDILMNDGAVTKHHLSEALQEQGITRMRLGEVLIKNGVITEKQLARAISTQLNIPLVSLEHTRPTLDALGMVPKIMAQRLEIIPLDIEDGYLRIAIAEPLNLMAIDELRSYTNMDLELMVATPSQIRAKLDIFYSGKNEDQTILI